MKRVTMMLAVLLGVVALAGPADATVLRVVVVETKDMAGYMADLGRIRAAQQRLGSKVTMRVWRARFAGTDAGALAVALEYPDWPSFAADDAAQKSDTEYSSILKGLDAKRRIVSDSIYEEVK
jgi:hypothetical protein